MSIEYGRADLFPQWCRCRCRRSLTWLSAKLNLQRVEGPSTPTASVAPTRTSSRGASGFTGDSVERMSLEATSVEVVGPSFSRIFDLSEQGPLLQAQAHHRARIDYAYVGEFDEGSQISLFDEIDRFRPLNGAVFRLTNRLLAKPVDEEEGGAFEIFSFELAQGYNFDDQPGQQDRFGIRRPKVRCRPSCASTPAAIPA